MADDSKTNNERVISARLSNVEIKQRIIQEARLRDHTTSEAVEKILELGLPKYLKRFPQVFERVDSAA